MCHEKTNMLGKILSFYKVIANCLHLKPTGFLLVWIVLLPHLTTRRLQGYRENHKTREREKEREREREREKKARVRWTELLRPHKTKLLPGVLFCCTFSRSLYRHSCRQARLSTVHYTQKLESCHRERNHYRGSGSLLLEGSRKKRKKKMGLRWWEAPDGLTDKLVNFMLGYLFIWSHSGS